MTTIKASDKEIRVAMEISEKIEKQYDREAYDLSHVKKELVVTLYCDGCNCETVHVIYGYTLTCSKCKMPGYSLTLNLDLVKTIIKNHVVDFVVVSVPQNIHEILIKNHKLMSDAPRLANSDGSFSIYKEFPKLYHSCGQLK